MMDLLTRIEASLEFKTIRPAAWTNFEDEEFERFSNELRENP